MPSEFENKFYPKIPTGRERPGAEITGRTKFGVKVERPASLQGLYDDGPSYDELMNAAKGTLARSFGNDTYEGLGVERENDRIAAADRGAANEQWRSQQEDDPLKVINSAVRAGAGVASLAPITTPVGAAGAGLTGLYSLADLATHDYDDPNAEGNPFFNASLSMVPALGRGAVDSGAIKGSAKATGTGAKGPFSAFPKPSKAGTHTSSIPPVEHYWDALDLGVDPAKAAKIAAGRDKASLTALESLQKGGKEARFDRWSRQNVSEVGRGGGEARIAQEGADEILARSVPTSPLDDAGRDLGGYIGQDAPIAVPKYIDPISGEPMFDLFGQNGPTTVSATQLQELGIPVPPGAMESAAKIRQLRNAAQSRFNSVR